jgi:hypothetical protein
MKASLLLAALALTIGAATAQTVAPGTAPGAQTGNPSNMPSAGSPTDPISSPDRMNRMSNADQSSKDKRMMRKSGKMKTNSGGTKTKTKL